ncbi:hypothetical protein G3N57_15800 [Paraburkholderia sp. Se-20369]|nr:hypothetical protein [Paraburkholderia sp. Se-20369]
MSHVLSTYNIIDVLTAFDVEEILNKYPALSRNREQPTPLVNSVSMNTIYMLTTHAHAVYGQGQGGDQGEGGSNLRIKADVNDIIRWRTVSLTDAADYKCFLYRFKWVGSSTGRDLLGPVTFQTANIAEPYPAQGWPENNKVNEEPTADYYAQATVLSPGIETYTFSVGIYDRHAQLKGYFYWDPYININNQ